MSKTRTPKHEIPKDWLKITDEEAIKRLNYLLIRYKEYNIEKQGNSIIIDGMSISPRVMPTLGTCFAIGYPVGVYWQDSPVYQLIEWLYNLCKTEAEKREQQAKIKAEKQRKIEKIKNFFKSNTHDTAFVATLIGISVLCATAIYTSDKITQEQQKQQKQFEKMLDKRIQNAIKKQEIVKQDSLQKIY